MKTYLMSRMIKLRQFPKSCSAYLSINIILYIIIYCIISHRSFNNIIRVRYSSSAINNKIKPFFCHFFKYKILKL